MFIELYIYMRTDVKVLEVLLWGRIASQPHFSWLVHAVSAPADKPAHICQWAGAEGPKAEACVVLRSPAHALHTGGERSGLTMPVFNLQV